jgi:ABC-type glycerol-3-phosphate transport system substrate-binding protein
MTVRAPIQPNCVPRLALVATVLLLMIRSPPHGYRGKGGASHPKRPVRGGTTMCNLLGPTRTVLSRSLKGTGDMSRFSTRRTFVKGAAGASAAMLAYGGGYHAGFAQDPTAVPTAPPQVVGEGGTEITMWVQDFGPAVEAFRIAAENYIAAGNDIKVTVQPIAFADLLAKMLPSIAAGNEADIMMGYTDWYVATDVSKLFLNLEGLIGTQAELEASLFPSTLQTIDMPEGSIYYVPWLAGANGVVTSYNGAMYQAAGIDPTTITTWDGLVTAGQELTQFDGDTMSVAGLSLMTPMLTLIKNWIWQAGGEFYNGETGEWALATPEGEAALQRVVDLVNGPTPTMSYDLSTIDNEYDVWLQGKIATQQMGAWTIGTAPEELQADGMSLPPLEDAVTDVVYPAHIGVITLSRRLDEDDARLQHCLGITRHLISADALVGVTNSYTGLICSQDVYNDPRILETKFGAISKRLAETTWPRSRWPKDHIANPMPASQELDRAARGEISVQEALGLADDYLNNQEQQARERLGL